MAKSKNVELALQIKTAVEGLNKVQSLIDEIEQLGGDAGTASEQGKKLATELNQLTDQASLIEQFRQLKTATGETGDQLAAAQQHAQQLGKQLSETEKPSRRMSSAFEKARKEVDRLKTSEQKQTASLQKLRKQLSGAGIDTRELADDQTRIKKSSAEATKKVEQLATGLRRTRDQARKDYKDPTKRLRDGTRTAASDVDRLGERIKSVRNRILAFVGVAAGINLVKRAFGALIGTGSEMETLRKQLDALMGSAEQGEQAFKWVQKFARDTPFEIDGVTKAFITLRNFGLDPTAGVMQAVADQAAELGGKQETLAGISLALGQAWARAKLQGQDILQLINQGVPVWELLAKVTGKNTAELQKMSEAGELGRDVMRKFIKAMGEGASGASAAQMDTFVGQMSNLRDNIAQLLDTVAQSGSLDFFKNQLAGLNDTISEMAKDGRLAQYAQQVSDAIVTAGNAVAGFAKTVYELRGVIVTAVKAFLLLKAINLGATVVSWAAQLTGKLAPALVASGRAAMKATTRVRGLGATLKALPTRIKIGIVVAGLDALYVAGKAVTGYIERIQRARIDEKIEAQNRAFRAHMAQFTEQLAAGFQAFADVRARSADELRGMTLDQLRAYQEQLKGAQKLAQYESSAAAYRGESVDELKRRVDALAASQKAVSAAIASTSESIRTGLTPAALELTQQFDALTAKGKTAAEALTGVLDGLDVGSATSVKNVVTALQHIVKEGKATGEELEAALGERLKKLSVEDFPRLEIAARAAFDGVAGGAQALATVLRASLEAQLKALGVDVTRLRTGMTDIGTAALQVFDAIVARADTSSETIAASFDAALGRVSTGKGLRALKDSLAHAFDEGKLSAREYQAELDKLTEKYEQLPLAEKTAEEQRRAAADQRRKDLSEWVGGLDDVRAARQAVDDADKAASDAAAQRHAQTLDELKGIEHQTTRTANALQGVENVIGGMSKALANMVEGVRSGLATLSEATRGYFDSIMGTAKPALSAMDQLRAKVQQATNALGTARANMGRLAGSVGTYIDNLALASARAQKAFYEQSLQAAQLTQQIEQNGFATARAADEAERAAAAFTLLGDEQLTPLRQAISAARQEFEQLSQTIHQETASLLDELNQLQGDQASIERRHYEQQIAELRAQANRAQEMGNQRAAAAAQQNLEIAQRIHDLKMRSIQEEAAAQRKADQEAARRQRETAAQSQTGTAGLTAPPPARTVRLEFSAPGTGTVAGTFDEGDAERLMDILRDAGARTVQ